MTTTHITAEIVGTDRFKIFVETFIPFVSFRYVLSYIYYVFRQI